MTFYESLIYAAGVVAVVVAMFRIASFFARRQARRLMHPRPLRASALGHIGTQSGAEANARSQDRRARR